MATYTNSYVVLRDVAVICKDDNSMPATDARVDSFYFDVIAQVMVAASNRTA
jgi:hypothetical protein